MEFITKQLQYYSIMKYQKRIMKCENNMSKLEIKLKVEKEMYKWLLEKSHELIENFSK